MSFCDSIDASVSYLQNKYVFPENALPGTSETRADLLNALTGRFERVTFQDAPEAESCKLLN